jgi:hypothetical protein
MAKKPESGQNIQASNWSIFLKCNPIMLLALSPLRATLAMIRFEAHLDAGN